MRSIEHTHVLHGFDFYYIIVDMNIQEFLRQLGIENVNFSFKPKYVIGFVFMLLLVVVVATSVFVVDETQQAVVVQFGKYNRTVGSGLKFKLPFGIEKNYNVDTQIVQNKTFGFRAQKSDVVSVRARGDYSAESTMLTGDLNIVNVEWVIQYKIADPRAWLFNVENTEKTISDISRSVINELVGDYYITDVLGNRRTEIEVKALKAMSEAFHLYNIGIQVTAVRLQNIVPPEGSVQDAFEDVNKAVQDMNRLINEGREAYNKEIPKARGQAEQLIQVAQGYAAERVNNAKGDVARFKSVLAEYNKSPSVTRERIYYETLEKILTSSEGKTQFIDKDFKSIVPFLSLQKSNSGSQALMPAGAQ